ncbi:conjugal transfer protein TraX [Salmonella enterica]|nr:conjugal transfer protein TraX [Salmonella enterica]MDJ7049000.1 conjugal transfer protein TraX [Salmonella enterica]MDJ7338068.1 conjugal transfer protein TraX [Salmonella enterica]
MKITFRTPALCAGLFMPVFPALASVSFQDIVTAATNPDDLSRQALVTIFGDVVTFCRLRTRWRVFFWLLLTPAVFLCGMALHAATLPPVTFWRLLTTLLCLLACAGLSASRALIVTYRLWQLRERRVSVEEKGTFRDFLAQTHGWGPTVWQAVTATSRHA